jgi:hypothetical protein
MLVIPTAQRSATSRATRPLLRLGSAQAGRNRSCRTQRLLVHCPLYPPAGRLSPRPHAEAQPFPGEQLADFENTFVASGLCPGGTAASATARGAAVRRARAATAREPAVTTPAGPSESAHPSQPIPVGTPGRDRWDSRDPEPPRPRRCLGSFGSEQPRKRRAQEPLLRKRATSSALLKRAGRHASPIRGPAPSRAGSGRCGGC